MAEEMISLEEHKKLQRKYDRRDRTAKEAEARIVNLESGLSRVESLMERLTSFIAGDDTALKAHADGMINENTSKRTADQTAAEFQSWLNRILDDHDEEWDDPKFDEARRIVEDINSSGDVSRTRDVERLMTDILSPNQGDEQERIDAAVAAALATRRTDSKRVDTGGTTARSGSVSRNDLKWNPSEGIGDLKSRIDQALDQITK